MIALYFAVYYLLALGITRVRAEVGPPTHEMFVANPRQFIIDSLGSRMIPPPSLTMMSLYFAFNRGVPRPSDASYIGGFLKTRGSSEYTGRTDGRGTDVRCFFRYPRFNSGHTWWSPTR